MSQTEEYTAEKLNTLVAEEVERINKLDIASLPPVHKAPESALDSSFGELIDHTILAASATWDQVKKVLDEALLYQFGAVCINPVWVDKAREYFEEIDNPPSATPKICTVLSFPLGQTPTSSKTTEGITALLEGATELDIVATHSYLLQSPPDYLSYYRDLASVRQAVREANPFAIMKVIMETSLLNKEQIIAASLLGRLAGMEYVKTSTGFVGGGAKKEDVRVMWEVVGHRGGKVKASGGVRTFEAVKEMVEAGAQRIGTSGMSGVVKAAKEGKKLEGGAGY
ncbi:deoxyribose-phosphate aldolase [Ascobolus immersus RN42]|uniref:deoxyribose-phosphate aldolase n=1 Tax=Ascobolus immersus RN42 TaxID=1160509 RepID=A0A3N4HRQ3_ASCIM|nr:deoxyribose-phosphate aldolase [Ascobolus immersus RN42]